MTGPNDPAALVEALRDMAAMFALTRLQDMANHAADILEAQAAEIVRLGLVTKELEIDRVQSEYKRLHKEISSERERRVVAQEGCIKMDAEIAELREENDIMQATVHTLKKDLRRHVLAEMGAHNEDGDAGD